MAFSWTEEASDYLRAQWAEGAVPGAIATDLTERYGVNPPVSRMAVSQMAIRLGLPARRRKIKGGKDGDQIMAMRALGMTNQEMANVTGLAPADVRQITDALVRYGMVAPRPRTGGIERVRSQSELHHPADVEAFAARMRHLRVTRGVSQAEVASMTQMANRTIRRLEAGTQRPRREMVDALAAALGVDRDTLLYGSNIEYAREREGIRELC